MSRSDKMTPRDKNMYAIIISVLVIGAYIFLVYAPLRTDIQQTENLINRRINRTEVRATVPDLPTESSKRLEEELSELTIAKDEVLTRLDERFLGFASLERADDIKLLRLEISSLAEFNGLTIQKFGDLSDSDSADTETLLKEEAKTKYARPILGLEVTGEFLKLQDFINGLPKLSKTVAISRLTIEAPDFDEVDSEENPSMRPQLRARLEIAL